MMYTVPARGVCPRTINIDVEDGIVRSIQFVGGCSGNTQGIAKLAQGMEIDRVIERLKGIRCGFKDTSCPDQLALALEAIKENEI